MGTILILFVYFSSNVALPFFYRKYRPHEFNVFKHVVLPVLGMVAIAVPVYYLCKPGQPQPYYWFPYAALGHRRGVHHLRHVAGQTRSRPRRPGRLDRRR